MGGSRYVYEMIKSLLGSPEPFYDIDHNKYLQRNRKDNPAFEKEFQKKLKRAQGGARYLQVHGSNDKPHKWKYSLNFKGLLLYLLFETKIERTDKRRIRTVLSNPKIIELAPFLREWQIFEKAGFDVTGVLRNMGVEYQNQLSYDYDEEYLLKSATKRYFDALSFYFNRYVQVHLGPSFIDDVLLQKLKEYHLFMLDLQEYWLKKDLRDITEGKKNVIANLS